MLYYTSIKLHYAKYPIFIITSQRPLSRAKISLPYVSLITKKRRGHEIHGNGPLLLLRCLIMRGELIVKGLKGLAEERLAKPDAMRQAYYAATHYAT